MKVATTCLYCDEQYVDTSTCVVFLLHLAAHACITCYTHATMPRMFLSLQCVCDMHVTRCDMRGLFKLAVSLLWTGR